MEAGSEPSGVAEEGRGDSFAGAARDLGGAHRALSWAHRAAPVSWPLGGSSGAGRATGETARSVRSDSETFRPTPTSSAAELDGPPYSRSRQVPCFQPFETPGLVPAPCVRDLVGSSKVWLGYRASAVRASLYRVWFGGLGTASELSESCSLRVLLPFRDVGVKLTRRRRASILPKPVSKLL